MCRIAFIHALIAIFTCAASAQGQPSPPNIVLILADDLGFSDAGCYGGEIPTPNIDRLAGEGVRFSQFYNNARCCPSRATLMTGKYPHQVGIGAMIDSYAKWIRDAADSPAYSDQLSKSAPTIAQMLRDGGYHTFMTGKWHLGYRQGGWPSARGFEKTFALVGGAMNYWGSETNAPPPPMEEDGKRFEPPKQGFFATDAFSERAVQYVREAASGGKPFFLYLAYNAPHWPLQAPSEDIEKHRGKYQDGWQPIREKRYERMRAMGLLDAAVKLSPMDRGNVKPWNELTDAQRDEWDLRMAVFAAMVKRMDRGIGQVMDALRDSGAEKNTLVLFLSDNGGAAEDPNRGEGATGTRDSFRGYARPWATVSNTPFRYHKVTAYEGGISAPLIARWPDGIAPDRRGQIVREPAHLVDLVPTLLEVSGTKPDPHFAAEGESLAKIFRGEPGNPNRTFAWEHEGQRGIRKGKWKLVRLADAKGWSLYDIEADRAEMNNVAGTNEQVVAELSAAYDDWAKRCGVVPWDQIALKRPATRSNAK
jgi:arylsulfatase